RAACRPHRGAAHRLAQPDRQGRSHRLRISHGPRRHLVAARADRREIPGNAAGVVLPAGKPVRAGLRLKFRVTAGAQANMLALDKLPVFIAGADELPKRLYEQLLGNALCYVVRAQGANGEISQLHDASRINRRGFDDSEALIPYSGRSFSGYRLLQEYFACPERFLFAEFTDLKPLLARSRGNEFE